MGLAIARPIGGGKLKCHLHSVRLIVAPLFASLIISEYLKVVGPRLVKERMPWKVRKLNIRILSRMPP